MGIQWRVWFLLHIGITSLYCEATEVDCSKELKIYNYRFCCQKSLPKLSYYNAQCGKYMSNQRSFNPCAAECIFKASKSLDGYKLNVENLREMLANVNPNNTEIIPFLIETYEECEKIIAKKFENKKASGPQYFGSNNPAQCSGDFTALLYVLCTVNVMFVKCPPREWTPTPKCEYARQYLMQCGNLFSKKIRGSKSTNRNTGIKRNANASQERAG